jgi:hypothetical protein
LIIDIIIYCHLVVNTFAKIFLTKYLSCFIDSNSDLSSNCFKKYFLNMDIINHILYYLNVRKYRTGGHMKRISRFLCAALILSAFAANSFAGSIFGKTPEGDVSVIDYGINGMGVGLFSGLAAGYVRYENEDDKGREILVSGAYGVLAGASLGIILGSIDASNGHKGIGAIILRDMRKGGEFGLLLGTIYGGIKALNENDSRLLGDNAAWGYLGGAVLGAAIAFIETPGTNSRASIDKHFNGSVAFLRDSQNKPCPGFAAQYTF